MRKDQRTVLVGDDEPLLLMDAAAMLSDADFKVLEATNADEAIAILESPCSVWAILIDVDMPGAGFHGRITARPCRQGSMASGPYFRNVRSSDHRR